MPLFKRGYFEPGYFAAPLQAIALPLNPDESISRWIGNIIVAGLAAFGLSIAVSDGEVPTIAVGDSTGRALRFPAVVFMLHSSSDRNAASAKRMMTWSEYKVLVIDQGASFAAQSAIMNVIDQAVISAQHGYTADGLHYVSRAYRLTALRYLNRDEQTGHRYNYQGGIYRLMHYARN